MEEVGEERAELLGNCGEMNGTRGGGEGTIEGDTAHETLLPPLGEQLHISE